MWLICMVMIFIVVKNNISSFRLLLCESLYVWGTADTHNDACIIILSSSQDLAINYSFYYSYLVYCNNICEWCVIAIVNQYFLRVLKRRYCCIFISILIYGTVLGLTSTSTNKTGDTYMDTLLEWKNILKVADEILLWK